MRKVCPTGYTMMRGVCKEIPNRRGDGRGRKPISDGYDLYGCGWGGCCNSSSDCPTSQWVCVGGKCKLAVVDVGPITRKGGPIRRRKGGRQGRRK